MVNLLRDPTYVSPYEPLWAFISILPDITIGLGFLVFITVVPMFTFYFLFIHILPGVFRNC